MKIEPVSRERGTMWASTQLGKNPSFTVGHWSWGLGDIKGVRGQGGPTSDGRVRTLIPHRGVHLRVPCPSQVCRGSPRPRTGEKERTEEGRPRHGYGPRCPASGVRVVSPGVAPTSISPKGDLELVRLSKQTDV